MNNIVKLDDNYKNWIQEISNIYKNCQIKASISVNSEMLKFYWLLGKEICEKSESFGGYGTNFYQKISKDLNDIFPNSHSFSETNLRYMRSFYELYSNIKNLPQSGENLNNENSPQLGEKLELNIFLIPWGHNKLIIDKCRNKQEIALFYVQKVLENNWSRNVLLNFLDTNLYEREGKAITNFKRLLPDMQGELAQALTKDPYNFDFLAIRERYDEKELKDALMNNITNYLLELGNGFAFVGREVRLEIGNTEKFIDMLFYNIKMKCYVVLEVKVSKFDSSYTGQLGTYVVAVNHQLKNENDNPTIGLLVCKDMDKVEASYALESSSQPIGVSGYELSKLIPEEFKGTLPTIEEIEEELNNK